MQYYVSMTLRKGILEGYIGYIVGTTLRLQTTGGTCLIFSTDTVRYPA